MINKEHIAIQSIKSRPAPPLALERTPHDQPEADWPQIRARLAADKIAACRNSAASPRDYVGGCVAGGCFEIISPRW